MCIPHLAIVMGTFHLLYALQLQQYFIAFVGFLQGDVELDLIDSLLERGIIHVYYGLVIYTIEDLGRQCRRVEFGPVCSHETN